MSQIQILSNNLCIIQASYVLLIAHDTINVKTGLLKLISCNSFEEIIPFKFFCCSQIELK